LTAENALEYLTKFPDQTPIMPKSYPDLLMVRTLKTSTIRCSFPVRLFNLVLKYSQKIISSSMLIGEWQQ
jgi:hypothetical protein